MKGKLLWTAALAAAMALFCTGCSSPAGSSGTANTEAAFTALSADGSASATTTYLTLTFDKDITGLAAADITLTPNSTGAVKGALTRTGTGTYELTVAGISAAGQISVAVSKSGYNITPASRNVNVFYYYDPSAAAVSFTDFSADDSYLASTRSLTLTFDKDIANLTAADITIDPKSTGTTKGALTPTGTTGEYRLTVTGITADGQISVTVSKAGYNISPPSRTANVFYYSDPSAIPVSFNTLTANGAENETTTLLTFTFDKDIPNLGVNDITITHNGTGTGKGILLRAGVGTYTLVVSGITASGEITVGVAKNGYTITPASKKAYVYYYNTLPGIGIGLGDSSVKLYLDNSPREEGGTSDIPLADTGTFTVSVAAGTYTEINWYLNGTLLPEASMKQSIVLSKQRAGTYLVTVEAKTGEEKNSGSHTFVVGE